MTLLVVGLLLLAALAVALVIGSRPRLPSPIGVATNGELAYDSGGTIFLADADGAHPRALGGSGRIDRTPTFSRDGTRFVFWSQAVTDGPLALYVANADGSDERELSGAMPIEASPLYGASWSPDGTRVLFFSKDGDVTRLYVVPADGSAPPTPITDRTADRSAASWSPDGKWIAYAKTVQGASPSEAIVVARPDGTGERPLYSHRLPPDGGVIDGPNWAPDSSALIYGRPADPYLEPDLGGVGLLAVAPLDGDERIIYKHTNTEWISWPGWSPDGALIAFGTGDNGIAGQFHLIRPDGTGDRVVFRGPPQGGSNCGAQWSPDAASVIAVCGPYVEIPVDRPSSARSLALPPGTGSFDWQRVAP